MSVHPISHLAFLTSVAVLTIVMIVWMILWRTYVDPLWDRFCDWGLARSQARLQRKLDKLNADHTRALEELERRGR